MRKNKGGGSEAERNPLAEGHSSSENCHVTEQTIKTKGLLGADSEGDPAPSPPVQPHELEHLEIHRTPNACLRRWNIFN